MIESRTRGGQLGPLGLEHQRFGQQANRAQRRAQLVRQVAHELGPDAPQPDQLRNVGQGDPDAAVIGVPDVQRHRLGRLAGEDVLARRVAVAACLGDELLDAVVQKRLEHDSCQRGHAGASPAGLPPTDWQSSTVPSWLTPDKADTQLISGLELLAKLARPRAVAAAALGRRRGGAAGAALAARPVSEPG